MTTNEALNDVANGVIYKEQLKFLPIVDDVCAVLCCCAPVLSGSVLPSTKFDVDIGMIRDDLLEDMLEHFHFFFGFFRISFSRFWIRFGIFSGVCVRTKLRTDVPSKK